MKYTLLFLLFLIIGFPAHAESAAYREIKTLPLRQTFDTAKDWRVTAFQPEGKEAATGDVSAKLCFWSEPGKKQEHCTSITSNLPNGEMTYHYQAVKELTVIPTPHLVEFIAEFSGSGSGTLRQISFWRYEKATDSFSQAGLVTLTEQGEYKLVDRTLITADARWGEGKSHFSSHRFDITVYQFAPDSGYAKAFSYLTTGKYPSMDDTGTIDVISHELPEIKKRLADAK